MSDSPSRDRRWPLLLAAIRLHVLLYRLTPGVSATAFAGAFRAAPARPHRRPSNVRRTTPLAYVRDGENVVLVASKGGFPRNPAWFHNLLAHPETTIQIAARRQPVRARVADPAERERLWPKAVAVYPGYEDYQRRTAREIPLVILEPRR